MAKKDEQVSAVVPSTVGYGLGGAYLGYSLTPFTRKGRAAMMAENAVKILKKHPGGEEILKSVLKGNNLTEKRVMQVAKMMRGKNALIGAGIGAAAGYGLGHLSDWIDQPTKKAEYVFEKMAKKKDSLKDALMGATAGSIATLATRPLENIEYNISTQGKYFKKPWIEVAKGLAEDKALWSGAGSKLLKVAPSMGITFAAYELLKNKFDK